MRRSSSVLVWRRRSPPRAVLDVLLRRLLTRSRGVGTLREDLLDAVHPAGALRRDDERTAALLRASTLPLYAVADWPGVRAAGGWSGSGRGTTAIELAFFAGSVDGPSVRVASSTTDLASVQIQVTHGLAAIGPRSPDLDTEAFFVELDARHDALAAQPWEPIELVVDGRARAAELLSSGEGWAAVWAADGVVVSVVSDRVPLAEVALERVDDVEPYIDGLAELRRRHA